MWFSGISSVALRKVFVPDWVLNIDTVDKVKIPSNFGIYRHKCMSSIFLHRNKWSVHIQQSVFYSVRTSREFFVTEHENHYTMHTITCLVNGFPWSLFNDIVTSLNVNSWLINSKMWQVHVFSTAQRPALLFGLFAFSLLFTHLLLPFCLGSLESL